jgi:hypothetical protein
MEEEKNEKGFVIKDRRHFDESGSVRKEEEEKREEEKKPEAKVKQTPPAGRSRTPPRRRMPRCPRSSSPDLSFRSAPRPCTTSGISPIRLRRSQSATLPPPSRRSIS